MSKFIDGFKSVFTSLSDMDWFEVGVIAGCISIGTIITLVAAWVMYAMGVRW